MRLLVAGGNALVVRLVQGIFQSVADIEECRNSENAVAAFGRCCPDFLLIDATLEENCGLRTIAAILKAFPDAKIIMLADYDDVELRTRALSAGAANYVLKDDLLSLAETLKAYSTRYDESKS